MSKIFDPKVKISKQALERKERFRKHKLSDEYKVEQDSPSELLPTIYFDDLGSITAVTYDNEFVPDDNWKTYDFDPTILKMIKNKSTSRYVIVRTTGDAGTEYHIKVRDKYNYTRELAVDTSLVHVRKLKADTEVDILVKVNENELEFSLSTAGAEAVKNSKVTDIKIHITEAMNPHILFETVVVNLAELSQAPITKKVSNDCEFKSLYGQRPFVYGRV